jgi:uncharacterized protein (DUF302 family)
MNQRSVISVEKALDDQVVLHPSTYLERLMKQLRVLLRQTSALVLAPLLLVHPAMAEEAGLITKASKYGAKETIVRFEDAVRSRSWVVFTEVDHAEAAKQVGLELKTRTVILFGNPRIGTAPMQKTATLAIDNPSKALVWEDDNGKVWVTYNSAQYISDRIYSRHGLSMPHEAIKNIERFLSEVSDQATQ